MGRILKNKYYLVTGIILAVCVYLLCFEPHNVHAETKTTMVYLDGVFYDLDADGTAEANIYGPDYQKLNVPSEITVKNKLSYAGKDYKVESFGWTGEAYDKGHWSAMIVGRNDFGRFAKDPYANNLKKLMVEKNIKIERSDVMWYSALEEVVLEDESQIQNLNFYQCPKLKSIFIPKDVKSNRIPIIRECSNVTITADPDNPYIKVINNDIYSKNGKVLYSVASSEPKYTVKSGVERINEYAFFGNDQIKSVYLPNTVKKLGIAVFGDMKNLSSIRISKKLTYLNYETFRKSTKLKSLTLPKNMKKLGGAFGGTSLCKLKKLYIYAPSLKQGNLRTLPKNCKVYVKNNTVKKQVRKYGFKGKIIINAKMK